LPLKKTKRAPTESLADGVRKASGLGRKKKCGVKIFFEARGRKTVPVPEKPGGGRRDL